MGELKYNFGGTNATTPNAYTGMSMPYMSDYLQTLVKAPQNIPFSGMPSLSSLSPQQLFMASGIDLAPTLGSTGNFSDGGFNRDLFNTPDSSSGNPLGLKLGAEAGGGSPKIAMTDKINAGVGVFNAAVGAISAYKALKLGKGNLNFQKDSFNKNYAASRNTTNAQLENAQRVRVSADPTNAMSVADYMAKYGVK